MNAPQEESVFAKGVGTAITSEKKKERVLVAEDNLVNQKIALLQLQKMGYSADAVANGLEVLESIKKIHYDLILMDCQMPEMDGFEASLKIRALEAGTPKHTLIIAMTANAQDSDRKKCLDAGMDDYISKPVNVEKLNTMLLNWFERKVA